MKKGLKIFLIVLAAALLALFSLRLLSGEDDWLCRNGQWIKHGQPKNPPPAKGCGEQTAEPEKQTKIKINSPLENELVSSPLSISGEARGNWFFEGVFPVKLLDENGQEIGQGQAEAQGEWMTENFTPFTASLSFTATTSSGLLILEKDNPSGLPENAEEVKIPLRFQPAFVPLKVFFSNTKEDSAGLYCEKTYATERNVSASAKTIQTALEELLKGPTAEEKEQGYLTNINPGVVIQKITMENGIASIDFSKKLEEAVGGSCRVAAIRSQIANTVEQFSEVDLVIISIDGRQEDILQP